MKRLILPFWAALSLHMLFLGSCDLPVHKPALSIVSQEISITLDYLEPAKDSEPLKQQVQKSKESEADNVEEIAEVRAEKNNSQPPFSDKEQQVEQHEIKEISTLVQADSVEAVVNTNRLETVQEIIPEPPKNLEAEALNQEQFVDIQESFVEDIENSSSSLSSVVIEAVPLYKLNPPPVYPRRARKRGYEGVVVFDVLVNIQGRPAEIKVGTSSGYAQLDRAAERAVWQWIFEPATRGQEKISMNVLVPIRFQLTDIKR